MHALTRGLLAGAAGTAALNIATYADMLVRGRPASSTPDQVADELAVRAGINPGDDEHAPAREQAAGALLGYVTGLGVGVAYAVFRAAGCCFPHRLAGPALAAAAMASSDVPAAALGVTRPGTWRAADWAADVFPHLAYGVTTACVYRALRNA
ncbi:hypothetical protein [Streptomyces marincola]|uniref:hypothetical protein n=1 Tax=Streptomyces marincola TaxID=2878388 RepID=UPI001CF54E36|nr:hypothetical protein [Streptomyces marincola]UCM88742.1 hypothetical protein LC193_12670 [Streptomyces marincola]